MRIALRLMLGFFLVLGLALFVVLRVFLGKCSRARAWPWKTV